MTDKFGNGGDPADKTSFGGSQSSDQGDGETKVSLTEKEYNELRKRDENAQQHIPRIEEENESMRQRIAELEGELEGSTTLKDVMDKLDKGSSGVSSDDVVDQVVERLNRNAKETTQAENWVKVLGQLKETHGTDEAIDTFVVTRAASLGMDTDAATNLAKTSPDAFMKLFAPQDAAAPQQGTASATHHQSSTHTSRTEAQKEELRQMYKEMRKNNPRKYWKTETQAQLRRDLYDA